MKKVIHTDDAPEAIGTYSQAVLADKFLFISGQIGLDPATMELVEGFEEETIQVFRNISSICKEAGCSINDVIKFNVLLTDLSNFQKVNEIMEKVLEAAVMAMKRRKTWRRKYQQDLDWKVLVVSAMLLELEIVKNLGKTKRKKGRLESVSVTP